MATLLSRVLTERARLVLWEVLGVQSNFHLCPSSHDIRQAVLRGLARTPSQVDGRSLPGASLLLHAAPGALGPLICIALAALGCEFARGVILWVREVEAQE